MSKTRPKSFKLFKKHTSASRMIKKGRGTTHIETRSLRVKTLLMLMKKMQATLPKTNCKSTSLLVKLTSTLHITNCSKLLIRKKNKKKMLGPNTTKRQLLVTAPLSKRKSTLSIDTGISLQLLSNLPSQTFTIHDKLLTEEFSA